MKKIRKHIFALFLAVVMCAPLYGFSAVGASDGVDPYSWIYGKSYDISQGSTLFIGDGEMVCGGNTGMHIGWKNVNFDRKPYELIVYLATGQFGQAELRLDSVTGKCIATLTPEIGAWDVSAPIKMGISEEIVGKHDLYFVWTAGPCNFDKMIFNTRETVKAVSEYAEYNENALYSDIAGHAYENDIETALALGLMAHPKTELFKPEKPVTRGAFAASLSTVIDRYTGAEVSFTDVSFSDEHYEAVCAVAEAGLLRGISETEFGINSFLTVGDALVASLRLLGYEKIAQELGGYPLGYMTLAQKVKLTNGLDTSDTLRNGNLARVLVNTINANYLDENGYVFENTEELGDIAYEEVAGILHKIKGIYKKTAVVEANNITSIYDPNGGTGINAIEAGGERYKAMGTAACSYLGMLCDYYYKEDGTLVAIVPNKRVKEIILNGELKTSVSSNGISYYKSEEATRATTLKCDNRTLYIYNEKAVDKEITDIVMRATDFDGKIRWVDNNADNIADVVFVSECENIVLNGISEHHVAGTKNGAAFSKSFSDAIVVFSKDGKEVGSDKIELGSVCMFYISANQSGEKFVRINTYTKSVEGQISEVNTDGVVIDGVFYKTHINLTLGAVGSFFLNANDEIVNYRVSVGGNKVAALFLGFDQTDGISSAFSVKAILKLATKDGVISIPCADKVKIDGVTCSKNSEVSAAFNGISERVPILYRANADGKITIIDTLNEVTKGTDDVLRQIGGRVEQVYYRTPQRCFTKDGYLRHPVSENAILMSYGTTKDDTYCEVKDFHTTIYDSQCFNAEFYSTTGGEKIADIVLWVNRFNDTLSGNIWESRAVMVEKTFHCVDQDGKNSMGIEGYEGNKKVKLYIDAEAFEGNIKTTSDSSPLRDTVLSLQTGDLILCLKNKQDEVFSLQLIYSGDRKANGGGVVCQLYQWGSDYKGWTGGDNLYNINMLGTVDSTEEKITKINLVNMDTSYVLIPPETPVIEYNRTTGNIIRDTGASLQSGDYIVVNIFDARVHQVFRFVQ